ncbi:MAG: cyclic nucleotide-binding domain-containing protein [Anaerolineales bacterium]
METSELVPFLTNIHLFNSLTPEQVEEVAAQLQEKNIAAGVEVIREGTQGNSLYLIYSGSVSVTQKNKKEPVARLVKHDHFGETALLTNRKHTATVTTLEPTVVFILSGLQFRQLAKKAPGLRPNLAVTVASYKLAHRLHFSWVRENEVIYFLATKHSYLLAQSLFVPVLSLLLPLLLVVAFFFFPAFKFLLWGAGATFLAIVLWIIWNTIDWGNDYYIVTNQRVVYLEKVIGLYDSTQQAPLSTILSVGVETDLLGRQMGFGNVIIRTFVGKIIFHAVSNPQQAAAVVEEHWRRSKETSRQAEAAAMRFEIKKRLGLLPPDTKPQIGPAPVIKTKPSFGARLSFNLFKVRMEKNGTITYRKHWFVLVQQTWQPFFLLLLMLLLLAYGLSHPPGFLGKLLTGPAAGVLAVVWGGLFISFVLWWIYQYIDWSNDIFQVTPDQILDIDRKPFGTEERKAAPLENILSTDARREGFMEYLLNYGTVYIFVGGAQFAFSDVTDPASVQQDVDNRRLARINAKAESQAKADRERLADWFATYHSINEEIRQAGAERKDSADPDETDVPEEMESS